MFYWNEKEAIQWFSLQAYLKTQKIEQQANIIFLDGV